MISFFYGAGLFLILNMILVFIRAIKGPTVIDRLLSINVIGTKCINLIIISGIIFNRIDMFVDIAIGYGLLNYIAAVGAAKYFQHYKTLNPEKDWASESRTVS
ncbi:pH regulation protein F [Candidatus Marinamargulisbacteria bacterium SCGC AG-333-B06]|nr:pH regulation protein F [Candidatus Marinamargulisbacteria bacterium SCGC AG-333-B06]